jgi:predicted dehydrogenase
MSSKNKTKLKVAFLGGAINSAVGSAHLSAIRMDNNYELVAGCFSREKERNHLTALQYGVNDDRIYYSLGELLSKEKNNLDAIIILTPTDQHPEQVIECLNSGVPIVCEKALACNSSDAMKIKNVLTKNNGFLSVIYNYLGYPMLRELKNIIEIGHIGKVQHIQVEMPQEGFIRVSASGDPIVPQSWRLHDDVIPTISLDLGVHLHMVIKYLSGESPMKVVSTSKTLGNFSEIIDNVSCIIEYSNGLTCNMWFSKIAIGKRNGLAVRVYGKTGSAEWVQENPEYLSLADNHGHRWTLDRGCSEVNICNQTRYSRFKAGHPAGFIEGYANYYYDIAASIDNFHGNREQHLTKDCFGINESLEGLYLFEAVAKSSFTKKWEDIYR